ncbi:MAG: serine hydrolase [Saprospiraceae bacterium]|nr:serine hydrolase [Saprospiraceae bacterium]
MKPIRFLFLSLFTICVACSPGRRLSEQKDPLQRILSDLQRDPLAGRVLKAGATYEVQILYTQIDRDATGRPSFRSFGYQLDSTRYFYPASTVKMPLALLSLEKINILRKKGFTRLHRSTPYRLDSLRAYQQAYHTDPDAPGDNPSIGHDVRQIFVVSDNLAYNHCFEFLGREYINKTLREKGYDRTGIVHRFNYPGRDNRYASPITFFEPTVGIYQEAEKFDEKAWTNPQHSTLKGRGYYNWSDSLINEPFDFSKKNWFALTDMEKMLRAVVFPEAVAPHLRFDLTDEDYRFLWHYMGIFPRECDYPKYDSTYHDSYVKFFLFGDRRLPLDGQVRSFNKVGEAYGTLTDVAYVADFENGVEFILAATILCNTDGIFNDDQYDYETIGLPFLAKLGRAVHAHEMKRKRHYPADMEKFREALAAGLGQKK